MYKDMILKMQYHKEEILKAFVKKGYFPKDDEITARLESIDKRIALFKTYKFQPGEKLNIKELNHCLASVHKDLVFLYKILEEISIIELNKLRTYVETHMTYLEDTAKHFKDRANEEVKSTTMGTTLFFKSGNWDIDTKDNITTVDLGSLDLIQGSKIACFAEVHNTTNNSVSFSFDALDDDYDFKALPYNYNNSTYKVPGDLEIKKQELKLNEDVIVNGDVNIPMSDLNENNEYYIMGGKKLMMVTSKDTNYTRLYDFADVSTPFYAEENCYITFYVADGTEIEYNFNKKPMHTNFSLQNGIIKCESDMQKVFLDVEQGFVCSFKIEEGDIWASKEDGIINGDNLVYNGNVSLRDFEIREYVKRYKTRYNIKLLIDSVDDISAVLNKVYIKEL